MRIPVRAQVFCFVSIFATSAPCQQTAEWSATTPVGRSLSSGFGHAVVAGDGTSFAVATIGASGNTDVFTVARAADGRRLWMRRYDGPRSRSDQGRAIALDERRGIVWVAGNTPNARSVANVLLLGYDRDTGVLQYSVLVPSSYSESGGYATVDSGGNVYVAGSTVGDGADVLLLKFDSTGALVWRRSWDGAAFGPYSQDSARKLGLDPLGNPVVLMHGVANTLQPDYYVWKLSPAGSVSWTARWGVRGGDYPRDMEIDRSGDVFVTGTGINGTNQLSTVRFRSSDGSVLWQKYDTQANRNSATGLALDQVGGVYILGSVDPDGDRSNNNNDILLVKRDAVAGDLRWTFRFGASCKQCADSASDVLVDGAGNVYLGGYSASPPFNRELVTFVLDAQTGAVREARPLRGTLREGVGTGVLAFDRSFALYNSSSSRHPTTGESVVSTFKYSAPGTYRLDATDMLGGTTGRLDVSQALPGAVQILVASVTGRGPLPIPGLGVTLGIINPALLAFGNADAAGRYSAQFQIPPFQGTADVWIQGLQLGAVTPVVERQVR